MDPVILRKNDLQVTFLPGSGMNFTSYKKGNVEAIDQSTRPLFEERYAGLGPMIGPHFHHRKIIPPIADESLFPHIARVRARGVKEPFSHGIGRYAPWTVVKVAESAIQATLSGKDSWNGVALSALEGQHFEMEYAAELIAEGLRIRLSVTSDYDSVVGLHTYYALANGGGKVTSAVSPLYNDQGIWKAIPPEWQGEKALSFDLAISADFGFYPIDGLHGEIHLETATHKIRVRYTAPNQENSWQLWHPEKASFACIEPLSAKDPRRPNLTASSLEILISIL